MPTFTYDDLQTYLDDTFTPRYKEKSLLGLFPSKTLPKGIADNKVALKYIYSDLKAVWTAAGFTPNEIAAAIDGGTYEVTTVSQRYTLTEAEQAFFQANGALEEAGNLLAEHVAFTANTALMIGKGGNQEAQPVTQYNFIMDVGASNGTVLRPNMVYNANAGAAWNSLANVEADVALAVEAWNSKFPGRQFIWMYSGALSGILSKHLSNDTRFADLLTHISNVPGCRGAVMCDNEFMRTIASSYATLPANTAADLIMCDPTLTTIYYARPERFRVVQGAGVDRNWYIEGEVWFCPVCQPMRMVIGGTAYFYKGVGAIKAIAKA